MFTKFAVAALVACSAAAAEWNQYGARSYGGSPYRSRSSYGGARSFGGLSRGGSRGAYGRISSGPSSPYRSSGPSYGARASNSPRGPIGAIGGYASQSRVTPNGRLGGARLTGYAAPQPQPRYQPAKR